MDAHRILKESIDRKDFHDLGKRLDEAELMDVDGFDSGSWPHAAHLLSHMIIHDLPNARFMSKRIPEDIAAEDTQIKRSRLILQQLWTMDYDVVWESILCPDWPADYSVLIEALADTIKRIVFGKICLVYRYIDVKKLGKLIGCTDDEVVRFAVNEYGAEHSDSVIVLPTLNKEKRMSEIDIQRLQSVLVQISQ